MDNDLKDYIDVLEERIEELEKLIEEVQKWVMMQTKDYKSL
jgi:hypothetical protein